MKVVFHEKPEVYDLVTIELKIMVSELLTPGEHDEMVATILRILERQIMNDGLVPDSSEGVTIQIEARWIGQNWKE